MGNSSIMINLEDPRTGKIADVISNKSAKRILAILSEKDMSINEIGKELGMRLNSVLYNIKKLVESGLIEETKVFLWSVKGKRIRKYRVVNKKIVISPKRLIRGIIPAVLISGAVAFAIKLWTISLIEREGVKELTKKATDIVSEKAGGAASIATQLPVEKTSEIIGTTQNAWLWFFAGALFGLVVYLVWNLISRNFYNSNKFEVKKGFK